MTDKQQSYLSKSLSFLLRHKDRSGGPDIEIDRNGFASLDDVVAAIASHHQTRGQIDAETIIEAVRQDEKGRFELSDGEDGLRIRALSGHSFPVDVSGEDFTPEGPLWFGTTMLAAGRIEENGLNNGDKLKVRLCETREEAERIADGRKGEPLLVEADAPRLLAEGYRFSKLANGEVVTDRFGREYCTLHPVQAAPSPGR